MFSQAIATPDSFGGFLYKNNSGTTRTINTQTLESNSKSSAITGSEFYWLVIVNLVVVFLVCLGLPEADTEGSSQSFKYQPLVSPKPVVLLYLFWIFAKLFALALGDKREIRGKLQIATITLFILVYAMIFGGILSPFAFWLMFALSLGVGFWQAFITDEDSIELWSTNVLRGLVGAYVLSTVFLMLGDEKILPLFGNYSAPLLESRLARSLVDIRLVLAMLIIGVIVATSVKRALKDLSLPAQSAELNNDSGIIESLALIFNLMWRTAWVIWMLLLDFGSKFRFELTTLLRELLFHKNILKNVGRVAILMIVKVFLVNYSNECFVLIYSYLIQSISRDLVLEQILELIIFSIIGAGSMVLVICIRVMFRKASDQRGELVTRLGTLAFTYSLACGLAGGLTYLSRLSLDLIGYQEIVIMGFDFPIFAFLCVALLISTAAIKSFWSRQESRTELDPTDWTGNEF